MAHNLSHDGEANKWKSCQPAARLCKNLADDRFALGVARLLLTRRTSMRLAEYLSRHFAEATLVACVVHLTRLWVAHVHSVALEKLRYLMATKVHVVRNLRWNGKAAPCAIEKASDRDAALVIHIDEDADLAVAFEVASLLAANVQDELRLPEDLLRHLQVGN